MRALRIMFTVCIAALAVVPASAMARHRSHHRHHRHTVRHARVRTERFGSDTTPAGTPQAGGSTNAADAGTVQSFTGGVLTIALTGGGTVSGTVNPSTEVECEMAEPVNMQNQVSRDGGGDNGGSGDNRGSDERSGGSGDDNAGNDDRNDEAGNEGACSTIAPGMVVRSAELRVSGAGAVWDKVELISQQ